ncbi:glycosyltransferase family 2 protein [Candidatus Gottesmanbacteria bacterium]|nr:glycosyltransferase family 2 protein [Candidatus Gottesmanbacteria bacterium]
MKTIVVIPNRNGAALLRKNLPAVLDAAKRADVIVVDDASTDDSVEVLKKEFPNVIIVQKDRHEGYASTVNAGVAAASGDIVVLLNSDVRPEKNFLAPLIAHFNDPKICAVGCLDKSIEGSTVVLRGRGLSRWEKGMFLHSRGEVDKTDTAWVAGGSGAFRKSTWNQLGGMDPLFDPFYWEDIDFSYRAVKAGYKILFEPKSVVTHEHDKGIIKQEYSPFQIKTIAYRNQFLFIWKNLSDPRIWIEHIFWTPVRLLQALFRGDFAMLLGYWSALIARVR